MAKLGDILSQNLKSKGFADTVEAARIVTELQKFLQEEFPKEVAERMAVSHFKQRAITVRVASSVIGQELKMHERRLLAKLTHAFPSVRVDRIRFTL